MNRDLAIGRLKREEFDVLVIGGGATGAGIAVDAASRGLRTALVEARDFSSGTSSRSTKLIHGGVRYLEKAVLELDRSQFRLVRDALHERSIVLGNAPHLTRWLPIITPLFGRLERAYYRTGLRMYDWLAGKHSSHKSRLLSKREVLRLAPGLRSDNLRGAVLYYDGQFDDSRMVIALAETASAMGAAIANYVEVTEILKTEGRVTGARLRSGSDSWEVRARIVINATGPFLDEIRKLDEPGCAPLLSLSSGIHIILDRAFPPLTHGVLVPKTEDKRVLFVLPWLGHTLVGTTDNPAELERDPCPSADDKEYLLRQLEKYFSIPLGPRNILQSWSGLRPLRNQDSARETAGLSRDHFILTSGSCLVSIGGGKWTTYRRMALDAVDEAIRVGGLSPSSPSRTEKLKLAGAENFGPQVVESLAQAHGLTEKTAQHLARSYGDRAERVAQLARESKYRELAPGHPMLEAEVTYAIREESARTAYDILGRRMRLAFLDRQASLAALPRVSESLKRELGWNAEESEADTQAARRLIDGDC